MTQPNFGAAPNPNALDPADFQPAFDPSDPNVFVQPPADVDGGDALAAAAASALGANPNFVSASEAPKPGLREKVVSFILGQTVVAPPAANAPGANRNFADDDAFTATLRSLLGGEQASTPFARVRPVNDGVVDTLLARTAFGRGYLDLRARVVRASLSLQGKIVDKLTDPLPEELRDATRRRFLASVAGKIAVEDAAGGQVEIARARAAGILPPAAAQPAETRPPVEVGPDVFIPALERLDNLQTEAGRVMAANLKRTLVPLVMSMVGEPAHRERMMQVLQDAERHVLTVDRLESEQRPLNPAEREYMERYGELTAANPWLVAAAEMPEAANVWLDAYFDRMDQQTQLDLPSGSYVPIIVNGGGLAGLINLATILAKRPDLIDKLLLADQGEYLAGVFGSPNGRAWLMNSKKLVGQNYFELPDDSTRPDYDQKVRGLEGGIFRWYPGERNDDPALPRTGSINRLGDLWVPPDVMGDSFYNDNFEIAVMIKEQMALALRKYRKNLALIDQEVNTGGGPGLYKSTYMRTKKDGSMEEVIYYTDFPMLPLGPGEFSTGLSMDQEFMDVVMAGLGKDGVPYYMNGQNLYKFAADRAQGPIEHGARWMVSGIGDTGITVTEILGRIFKTTNLNKITSADAQNIDTIYLIASKEQSKRGRYLGAFDLRTRDLINNTNAQLEKITGRANILQVIDGRAEGLAFESGTENLVARDANGAILRDNRSNEPARVDHFVECVGIQPAIDSVLETLAIGAGANTVQEALEDVYLPNNPQIPVARTLRNNPAIHINGTATGNLYNADKEALVPPGTRIVLRDVPANRVSIGLQGPDIQAGASIQIDSVINAQMPAGSIREPGPVTYDSRQVMTSPITAANTSEATVRRDKFVDLEPGLLMTLLFGQIAENRISADGQQVIDAHIAINGQEVTISQPRRGNDGASADMPLGLAQTLAGSALNPAISQYLAEAVRTRRGATGIDVRLAYEGGKLKLEKSFALVA